MVCVNLLFALNLIDLIRLGYKNVFKLEMIDLAWKFFSFWILTVKGPNIW